MRGERHDVHVRHVDVRRGVVVAIHGRCVLHVAAVRLVHQVMFVASMSLVDVREYCIHLFVYLGGCQLGNRCPQSQLMLLELVIHCWAGHLPIYAKLLTAQLSSLVRYQPQSADVLVTVFHAREDRLTAAVLDYFGGPLNERYHLCRWSLETRDLFRRAIGRNLAARSTPADWVWFTDCDYLFRDGCLDSVPAAVAGMDGLCMPRITYRHKEHALGDFLLDAMPLGPHVADDVDEADFEPYHSTKAIGGIQIVPGAMARQHGYGARKRYQQQIPAGEGFRRCVGDAGYRRDLKTGYGMPVEIPNLYRIRHTEVGRDV